MPAAEPSLERNPHVDATVHTSTPSVDAATPTVDAAIVSVWGRRFSEAKEFLPESENSVIRTALVSVGCLGIVAAVIVWFLVSALLGMAGVPLNMLWAALIALAVLGVLVGLKIVQVRSQLQRTKIVVSPSGIAQHDSGKAVRVIAWDDLLGADYVKPLARATRTMAGTAQSRALGDALGNAASSVGQRLSQSVGLVGYGRVDFADNASLSLRQSYVGAFGTGPDGRHLVGITPTLNRPDWSSSELGEWLAHFRPDVSAAVQTLEEWTKAGSSGDRPVPPIAR